MPQRYRKRKVNGKTRQLSRVLMEEHLGRPLGRFEYVHHKNHDKLDDRLENYELTTPKDHAVHHNQKHPVTKNCVVCGREFTPQPTKRASKKTCSDECYRKRASANASAQRWPVSRRLTNEQIASIPRRLAAGESQRALERAFGVAHGHIAGVLRRLRGTP